MADEVVNRCQQCVVHDQHEEMRYFESQHSLSGWTKVGKCLHSNVSQQTQVVIVTIFVPAVFACIAWEEFLIVDVHSIEHDLDG